MNWIVIEAFGRAEGLWTTQIDILRFSSYLFYAAAKYYIYEITLSLIGYIKHLKFDTDNKNSNSSSPSCYKSSI